MRSINTSKSRTAGGDDIELQDFNPSHHESSRVSAIASNPVHQTTNDSSCLTAQKSRRRPASPSWQGPNDLLDGENTNATYRRAVRTLLQHHNKHDVHTGSLEEASMLQQAHTWLVAATQSVHTPCSNAETPIFTQNSPLQAVRRYISSLLTNTKDRNSELGKASRVIMAQIRANQRKLREDTEEEESKAAKATRDAELLGYWP